MSHKYDEPQFEQRLGQILQQAEDMVETQPARRAILPHPPPVLGAIFIVWLALASMSSIRATSVWSEPSARKPNERSRA
jgi:hypothetical protein